MSGSFWKFGQDYSIESPVSKILNSAFIKIDKDQDEDVPTSAIEEHVDTGGNEPSTDGLIPEKVLVTRVTTRRKKMLYRPRNLNMRIISLI